MRRLKRYRHILEVFATRLGLLVLPRLPRPVLVRFSRLLGALAFRLARRLRAVGRANLDRVYGDTLSPAEKDAILRRAFQTFALVLADVFWFTRHPRERLRRHVHLGPEHFAVLDRAPLICVTAHLGNWETLGQAVSLAGYPLTSVAAPLKNPGVDRLFVPTRELTGQTILSSEGALRKLLHLLKSGGRFAILLDQNTKPSEGGAFVPFLGLPAPVSTGAALLALRTRSTIGIGFAIPDERGDYQLEIPRCLTPDEIEALTRDHPDPNRALTETIVETIGEAILRHPECWLWMYRRWKYVAPGHDREDYPAYAKALPESESAAKSPRPSRGVGGFPG